MRKIVEGSLDSRGLGLRIDNEEILLRVGRACHMLASINT